MKEPITSEKQIAVTSDIFSRRIINRYEGFGSSTQNFNPLISTGGIIPLLGRWIELIYTIPFFSSKQEITHQRIESIAGRVNKPASYILNLLLNFSGQKHILQARNIFLDETLKKLAISLQKSYLLRPNISIASPVTLLFSLSEAITHLHQQEDRQSSSRDRSYISTPTAPVSQERSQLVFERAEEISHEESSQRDFEKVAPLPLTGRRISTILNYQRPIILHTARDLAISSTGKGIMASLVAPLVETKGEGRETAQSARSIADTPGTSGNRQELSLTSVPASTQGTGFKQRETINRFATQREAIQAGTAQRVAAEGSQLNILKLTKIEPIYRTYPVMETINSRENSQVIRETQVIEKEVATRQPPPPKIDIERLTEEVYRLFERRVRIEKERRGL